MFSYVRITFFALATLTFIRWPWHMNITEIFWRCTCVPKMKFLGQCFQKLEHKQDRQMQLNALPAATVGDNKSHLEKHLTSTRHITTSQSVYTVKITCSSVSEDRLRAVVQDSIFGLKWLIIAWTLTIAFVRRIADSFHCTSVVVYLNARSIQHNKQWMTSWQVK